MDPLENVDARTNLATWLREGRTRKQLTIEDVAKITKIQLRILERLESGQSDGLPAEVFVKGFVRSFAKCVGLDENEAIDRYAVERSGQQQGVVVAQALAETLVPITQRKIDLLAPSPVEPPPANGDPEPVREAPLIEARPLPVEALESPKKPKRSRKKQANQAPRSRRKKQKQIDAESIDAKVEAKSDPAIEIALPDGAVDEPALAEGGQRISQQAIEAEMAAAIEGTPKTAPAEAAPVEAAPQAAPVEAAPSIEVEADESIEIEIGAWQPTMPPMSSTPSVPWRRPNLPRPNASYVVPSLVIDDADPDSADRERDERLAKEPHPLALGLSFLPPILLDREDRSSRQGGLTLAVIILLIAATLTLSYLMRRPSSSGDGVTMNETSSMMS